MAFDKVCDSAVATDRSCPNVSTVSDKIDYGPSVFATLEMVEN
jgi:hypothetical protein